MTKVYLIRHAEAEGNVYRRLHGQYNSMLTPNGLKQVAALEKRFADIHIDAVYSSDLTRTCITASALYRPKGLPLHTEPRFRELSCGIWEDIPFGQLERDDPARLHTFSHDPWNWQVEGGENAHVYTTRFIEALDETVSRHEGQTIAIFSHGMVLRGVLEKLFFPKDPKAVGHCENTGVTCITWEQGNYHLEFLNDATHIPAEISTLGKQNWWRGNRQMDFNMWFRDAENQDVPLLEALGCRPKEGQQIRISMLKDNATGIVATRDADKDADAIDHLALLPEYRGRGLSPQLIGEAVSQARRNGKRALVLTTCADHPVAKALFDAYGFCGEKNCLRLYPTE